MHQLPPTGLYAGLVYPSTLIGARSVRQLARFFLLGLVLLGLSVLQLETTFLVVPGLTLLLWGGDSKVRVLGAILLLVGGGFQWRAEVPVWGWEVGVGGGAVLLCHLVERSRLTLDSTTRIVLAGLGAVAVVGVAAALVPPALMTIREAVASQLAVESEGATAVYGKLGFPLEAVQDQIQQVQTFLLRFLPGLVALNLMAALAMSGLILRLVTGGAQGWGDRGPFTEFEFHDQLIWVLVLGLALSLVPQPPATSTIGVNLALVMGTLYLLRGTAITAYWGRRASWPVRTLLIIGAILALPLTVGLLAFLGLSDTWVGWRSRVRGL